MAYLAIRVERCSDGVALVNANVTDNLGTVAATDASGNVHTYAAYVGYRITSKFSGMLDKTYIVTQSDIDRGYVVICLDPDPDYVEPEPITPRSCFGSNLTGERYSDRDDALSVPALLRQVRDEMVRTPVGKQLVEDYYDERMQAALNRVFEDANLRFEALRLVVAELPLLREFVGESSALTPGQSRVVSSGLVDDVIAFARALHEQSPELGDILSRIEHLTERARCHTVAEVRAILQSVDEG